MCVWLQENHPYVPPLVFVKPTSSMAIKPSHHVDTNGKVYLPFLHEWAYVCILNYCHCSSIKCIIIPVSSPKLLLDMCLYFNSRVRHVIFQWNFDLHVMNLYCKVLLTDPRGGSSLLNYIKNKLNYIVYTFLWHNGPTNASSRNNFLRAL